MKPGDLVHVNADNFYHGVGLLVEVEDGGAEGFAYYVLMPDSRCLYYFPYELEEFNMSDAEVLSGS